MDYEKAYKDTIAKAREIHRNEDEKRSDMEWLFPELKNKDEEIRKALIKGVESCKASGWTNFGNNVDIDVVLAWLKEQGKQKPIDYNKELKKCRENPLYFFDKYVKLEKQKPACSEEDERVKKRILLSLEKDLMATKNSGCDTQDLEQCIAWLEKQCYTKKDVDDAYLKGISDAKNELEKQGEQKTAVTDFNAKDWYVSKVDGKIHDMTYNPTDKVEPKFHKGEWIVWKNKCYKVNYNGCGYELIDQNGLSTSLEYGTVDTSARLYDVTKDAKDGDVVFDKSDGTIGIFQSIGHHPDGGSYNDPSYCFLHCRYDDGYFFADFEDGNMMTSDDVIPATKEQRDTLMKAMADAGWKFDFDKKELKKIGDEIEIPFGAKDSELQEETYFIPDGFHAEIEDDKVVIKRGEKSAAWSDEDDAYKLFAISAVEDYYDEENPLQKELTDWLKSLKDRIICKNTI